MWTILEIFLDGNSRKLDNDIPKLREELLKVCIYRNRQKALVALLVTEQTHMQCDQIRPCANVHKRLMRGS